MPLVIKVPLLFVDWKSRGKTLIKKAKIFISKILIWLGWKQKRCEYGRVLTEEQALEFQKNFNQIPDNMLEFIGDYDFEKKHK